VERDGPLFKDGHVLLTDAPGLGVRLNQKVCQKYLAPGQELLA
jgi:L-alanine-DL-glutamate epimerase-like enolase superfamily enzyme